MSTTNATAKEDIDESDQCDNEWCDGPISETLPCFECFDPNREYSLRVGDAQDQSDSAERVR